MPKVKLSSNTADKTQHPAPYSPSKEKAAAAIAISTKSFIAVVSEKWRAVGMLVVYSRFVAKESQVALYPTT
jgi:hypothetical protein